MMRVSSIVIFLFLVSGVIYAQDVIQQTEGKYVYQVDLTSARGDQVEVVLIPPKIESDTLVFVFPSVVPGCYSYDDFGRFIDRFQVKDKSGKRMRDTERVGDNAFFIYDAKQVGEISYRVDDTWIDEYSNYVFQPCGSYINRRNAFVINHHAFFGFYDGYSGLPFEVEFKIPSVMMAASAIQPEKKGDLTIFKAKDYAELIDNPILIAKPDQTTFQVGETTFHIAVHSTGGTIDANKVREIIQPDIEKIYPIIGSVIPKEYHFLMFFTPGTNYQISKLGGFGALEHEKSMLAFLPEEEGDLLKRIVSENAIHELAQLISPINLRSSVFTNLDYIEPEMCAHLWLYEGVTEYVTHLLRMKTGIISQADFMEIFLNKVKNSKTYPDVSFTRKSKNILDPTYQDMFSNIFDKGALIGFFLDLDIIDKSNGSSDIIKTLLGLVDNFGKDRPFNENTFMAAFSRVAGTDFQPFFNQYVIGTNPLPFKEYFNRLGWYYRPAAEAQLVKAGNVILLYDESEDHFFLFEGNSLGLRNRLSLAGIKVGNLNLDMNSPKKDLFNGLRDLKGQQVTLQYKRNENFVEGGGRAEVLVARLGEVIQPYPAITSQQMRLAKLFFSE
jgi:predicted metalloprotease with PDZ domain